MTFNNTTTQKTKKANDFWLYRTALETCLRYAGLPFGRQGLIKTKLPPTIPIDREEHYRSAAAQAFPQGKNLILCLPPFAKGVVRESSGICVYLTPGSFDPGVFKEDKNFPPFAGANSNSRLHWLWRYIVGLVGF